MINTFASEITEVIQFYHIANRLCIKLETYGDVGYFSIIYELRNSYDHFLEACKSIFEVDQESYNEDSIKRSFRGAKNHLVRAAYDSAEIFCLDRLRQISAILEAEYGKDSTDKYPLALLARINEFKSKLFDLKLEKGLDIALEKMKSLQSLTEEIVDFLTNEICKNDE